MVCCNIDENIVKSFLPRRKSNSHKGTYGHVLNIAGSNEYRGAAYLSSIGAFKTGCGLVTLAASNKVIDVVSNYNPMIIYLPLMDKINPFAKYYNSSKIIKNINKYDVVCVGCGLGINALNIYLVKNLIKKNNTSHIPFIIDADAINIMAREKITTLPPNSIITPHPKELSRLLNVSVENIQNNRVEAAIEASRKYKCITLLKGENTVISNTTGEKVYINTNSGNSALSKAGSGDVLAGMISGFLAQMINDYEDNDTISEKIIKASVISTYIHLKAAKAATIDMSEYSALQEDIINSIASQIKIYIVAKD